MCGGLHSLDHAALTSFEHERAHYGAHISPFVLILSVDAQRRTERVSTLVATEYEERRTERISTVFGRGQVRGAPCTERISTLLAAEYADSTGWAALARSMARSMAN